MRIRTLASNLPQVRRWALTATCASILAACGGGGGGDSVPVAESATTIDGGVVKGPVLGATVCVYRVTSGAKGEQVAVTAGTGATGSVSNGCYVTGADGTYNMRLPEGTTGDLMVESTGGSFCSNESAVSGGACTGATLVSLGSSVMSSVVTAQASASARVYTTPLTTAAVDNALAAGALSAASFNNSFATLAGQVGASTSLSPSAAPTVATQSYLTAVAEFLKGGGTLTNAVTLIGKGTTPVLVQPSAVAPGFWSTNALSNGPEGSTRASAIVMPDLTTWVAFESATSVVGVSKLAVSASPKSETTATVTATGSYYSIANGGAALAQSASGTVTSTPALQLSSITTAGSSSTGSATFASQAGFKTAAALSSVASARFVGNLGGGQVQVTWDLDAAGALKAATSTSSTGCTYTGSVTPNAATIAVFDVAVSEDCQGTVRTFAGIATFRAAATNPVAPASLRVIFTALSGSVTTGGVLALDKQ